MITLERVQERLLYDPLTGIFTWRERSWRKVGSAAGSPDGKGYCKITIDRKHYYAHRLAWLYMTGEWPQGDIDHKNGVASDNTFSNLRLATRSQNTINSGVYRTNVSGFKGVHINRKSGKWTAEIRKDGRRIALGLFTSPEEAHQAYARAARQLFGEFARAS